MTPGQLRARLLTLLGDQLGTYTAPGGTTFPAIRVGEPPSDWVASGVEVRIDDVPEFDNQTLHHHTSVVTELTVRVIPHGAGAASKAAEAVTRITQALNTSNPRSIPPNEQLGILKQLTLRVK